MNQVTLAYDVLNSAGPWRYLFHMLNLQFLIMLVWRYLSLGNCLQPIADKNVLFWLIRCLWLLHDIICFSCTVYDTHVIKQNETYHQTSQIRCKLMGNLIYDHSGVVAASPVGAAPATSSFSAWHIDSFNELGKYNCKTRRETFNF